jgi:hypothetical protein
VLIRECLAYISELICFHPIVIRDVDANCKGHCVLVECTTPDDGTNSAEGFLHNAITTLPQRLPYSAPDVFGVRSS